MTVTSSQCPRAFARSTQKPFSTLWNVTRSTRPASTSWVDGSGCGFIRNGGSLFSAVAYLEGQASDSRPPSLYDRETPPGSLDTNRPYGVLGHQIGVFYF